MAQQDNTRTNQQDMRRQPQQQEQAGSKKAGARGRKEQQDLPSETQSRDMDTGRKTQH